MATQAQRLQQQQRLLRLRIARQKPRTIPQQALTPRGVAAGRGDLAELDTIVASQTQLLRNLEARLKDTEKTRQALLSDVKKRTKQGLPVSDIIQEANLENTKLFAIRESIQSVKQNVQNISRLKAQATQKNVQEIIRAARQSSFSSGQIARFITQRVSGERATIAIRKRARKFGKLSLEEKALRAGAIGQTETGFIFRQGEVSRKEFARAIRTGQRSIKITPVPTPTAPQPTETEIILRQSLPAEQRFIPAKKVISIQDGTGISGERGVSFTTSLPGFLSDITTPFRETFGRAKEDIAIPFLESFGAKEPLKKGVGKIQGVGEVAQEKIGGLTEDIRSFLTPTPTRAEEKLLRISKNLEVESKKLEKDIKQFNKKVSNFNKRFGNRQLLQSEVAEAQKQRKSLEMQARNLDTRIRLIENKRLRVESFGKATRKAREFTPGRLQIAALQAFATAPLDLASTTIGLLTKPSQTLKETGEGILALPEAFVTRPFTTTGTIVGSLAGQSLIINSVASSLSKAKTITSVSKVPTKASQSYQISNALQIGTDEVTGLRVFRVKAVIRTSVVNAKTNKLLRNIETKTESIVITAKNPQDAIKTASKTVALSIREGSQRVFVGEPRITQKFTVNTASGKATFQPIKEPTKFAGTLTGKATDFGVLRIRATPKELTGKVTKFKAKPEADVLSNINALLLGERGVSVRQGRVSITGRESFAVSKILTDITPTKLRVKGFERGGRRIQPIVRKFPSTVKGGKVRFERFDRDLGIALSRSFIPEDITLSLGRKAPKKIDVTKIDKSIVDVSGTQKQIKVFDEKLAAKLTAEAQVRQVGARVKQQFKDITKTVKVSQRQLPGQKQAVFTGEAQILTQRQQQAQQQKQKLKQLTGVTSSLASLSAQDVSQAQIQKQTQIQALKTLTKLKAPASLPDITGVTPTTPTITEPIPPKKPKLIPLPLPREDKNLFRQPRKQPYDVFIKKKKIADNLSRQRALDFGAFIADNTIAGQFRIKKSKGKMKPTPINAPQNYFNFNRAKFRAVKIRKGVRIPIKNRFIEKRNRRLDTVGETQQITAARFIKQRRKRFLDINKTINFNRMKR